MIVAENMYPAEIPKPQGEASRLENV